MPVVETEYEHIVLDDNQVPQVAVIEFAGVIYTKLLKTSIGDCVREPEMIAKAGEPEDLRNQIQFLPL